MRARAGLDVEAAPAGGLGAEHDVLEHGQVVGEHEVLVHHADAGGDGVGGRGEAHRARRRRVIVPSSGFCIPYRIFISVDLPAPFSPTTACTSPGRTTRSTSRLATTPGNRLPMPCEHHDGLGHAVSSCCGSGRRGPDPARAGSGPVGCYGVVGTVISPDDDLGLELVELGLDVVDRAARGRVADALGLEVEGGGRRDVLALVELLQGLEHRDVDALEHRGEDDRLQGRVADRLVLVGVDADRELLLEPAPPGTRRRPSRRPRRRRRRRRRRTCRSRSRGPCRGRRSRRSPAAATGSARSS